MTSTTPEQHLGVLSGKQLTKKPTYGVILHYFQMIAVQAYANVSVYIFGGVLWELFLFLKKRFFPINLNIDLSISNVEKNPG